MDVNYFTVFRNQAPRTGRMRIEAQPLRRLGLLLLGRGRTRLLRSAVRGGTMTRVTRYTDFRTHLR